MDYHNEMRANNNNMINTHKHIRTWRPKWYSIGMRVSVCVCVYIDISYYGVIVRASRTIDVDMQVKAVLSLVLYVIDKINR